MTEQAVYTLWMILSGKQCSARNYTLIKEMSAKEVYYAAPEELASHVGKKDAEFFANKDLSQAKAMLEDCRRRGIEIVCYPDAAYPPLLREIDDPPLALFVLSSYPLPTLPTVGIVGTRRCSRAAAGLAASLSGSLSMSGFQVVSGMANGIDTYVHKGSLLKGKPTYAVLGCGVDVVYPKANQNLYDHLLKKGGLISEYLPGTPPLGANFPRRNRIISGLSDGVVVVECPERSGSMITARYAIEQNRSLFAVPTAATEQVNTGTNLLLRQGAIFCTDVTDVCREFEHRYGDRIKPTFVRIVLSDVENASPPKAPEERRTAKPQRKAAVPRTVKKPPPEPEPPKQAAPPSLSDAERAVYEAFSPGETLTADEICARTGLPLFRALTLLQALELTKTIESLPGSIYRRK